MNDQLKLKKQNGGDNSCGRAKHKMPASMVAKIAAAKARNAGTDQTDLANYQSHRTE